MGMVSKVAVLHTPPKLVYDDSGKVVEVILAYHDYRTFLKTLAATADWESLPPYLQDDIDAMLAQEARAEGGELRPLRELLAETGDTLEGDTRI